MTSLMWFRSDLRVDDNAALVAATAQRKPVMAVFYAMPTQWSEHAWAPVKVDFLWRNLECLRDSLAKLKIPLFVRRVERFASIPDDMRTFAQTLQCQTVWANREYPIDEERRDSAVATSLSSVGIDFRRIEDSTLVPPGSILTLQGNPFKVFTPFKRALLELIETAPTHCLKPSSSVGVDLKTPEFPLLDYAPSAVDPALWPAGETAAKRRLRQFVSNDLEHYAVDRDIPARPGTSLLSPYLALGVISIRRCAEAVLDLNGGRWQGGSQGATCWLNELIWREFYIHVLAQFPRVSMNRPLRIESEQVNWRRDPSEFKLWCEGRTGFPLVDAGMRQLREMGWMHNRLRMLTAMFLSKYLLLDWRWGEEHFMRHLIDGDLAANNGGWQWSASTGTDAVPYFRLLSPVRQAERFDPDGVYCKRYLPELAHVPAKLLQQPGHPQLLAAGYPAPLLDLKSARLRVLKTFAAASAQHRDQ